MQDRKARFMELNAFVTERHGWLTSIPGDIEVEMQCLPGSSLPDDLRKLGYVVAEIGETQRILPTAIVERFVVGGDGTLQPLLFGSTEPVAQTVKRYDVYKIDYGCYVDLISTSRAPVGLLAGTDDGAFVDVPPDDYRSIRRAILRPEDIARTPDAEPVS